MGNLIENGIEKSNTAPFSSIAEVQRYILSDQHNKRSIANRRLLSTFLDNIVTAKGEEGAFIFLSDLYFNQRATRVDFSTELDQYLPEGFFNIKYIDFFKNYFRWDRSTPPNNLRGTQISATIVQEDTVIKIEKILYRLGRDASRKGRRRRLDMNSIREKKLSVDKLGVLLSNLSIVDSKGLEPLLLSLRTKFGIDNTVEGLNRLIRAETGGDFKLVDRSINLLRIEEKASLQIIWDNGWKKSFYDFIDQGFGIEESLYRGALEITKQEIESSQFMKAFIKQKSSGENLMCRGFIGKLSKSCHAQSNLSEILLSLGVEKTEIGRLLNISLDHRKKRGDMHPVKAERPPAVLKEVDDPIARRREVLMGICHAKLSNKGIDETKINLLIGLFPGIDLIKIFTILLNDSKDIETELFQFTQAEVPPLNKIQKLDDMRVSFQKTYPEITQALSRQQGI